MAYKTRTVYCRLMIFLCLMVVMIDMASASVTMLGNRVIYPAQAREKTLQFSNDGHAPALIQVWLDIDNEKSTPETADAPFITSPQLFRINPHSGQVVRLIYHGKDLPVDRESLFYLNFLQVPAVRKNEAEENKLILLVRNRLKVFYRPEGLMGESKDVGEKLRIQRRGQVLQVSNPTPYYANISHGKGVIGNKSRRIEQADMIPPYSQVNWLLSPDLPKGKLKVVLSIINDYGVEVPVTLAL